MTDKYQEALDWFNAANWDERVAPVHKIREALQAGAEGRILPVYPCAKRIAIDILPDEIICIVYTDGCIFQDSALTPAKAMQTAIDKMSGCNAQETYEFDQINGDNQ